MLPVRSFLTSLLALLLLSAGPLVETLAAAVRCVQCGREVTDTPRNTPTGVYCSESCEREAVPHCASCGELISGRHLVSDGKRYCSQACFERTLPHCAACNATITGRYWERHGKRYCSEECGRSTLQRCFACGEPVTQGRTAKGRVYCERDAALPSCVSCGLPAVDGKELTGGRWVCGECRHDLIDTKERAEPLYRRAAEAVEAITGLELGDLPAFRLVSQEELLEAGKGLLGPGAAGLFRGEREYEVINGKRAPVGRLVGSDILLLRAQSPADFEVAAVHELTHLLMSQRFAAAEELGPEWLSEGAAEYVSWIAARRLGHEDLASRMSAKDPPYGPSLQWMQRRFGDDGWRSFVLWLRRQDPARLPASPRN